MSYFHQGILAAKWGKEKEDVPKSYSPIQKEWWLEGFAAAHNKKYVDGNGILIKDKPIYEKDKLDT